MSKAKKSPPRFHVGDWVSFLAGVRQATGQVVEDRGPIGVQGRRLYRIRWELAPDVVNVFEHPEEYLEAAAAPNQAKATQA